MDLLKMTLIRVVTVNFLSNTQEHLERATTLRDDDPTCYYLLGRWHYEVKEAVCSAAGCCCYMQML